MYKILSLDGGGAWTLVQAQALAALYGPGTAGHDILARFDMVAANSSGTFVLAGLIQNMSPNRILDLYMDPAKQRKLRKLLPWHRRLLRIIGFGPRFYTSGKLHALKEFFQQAAEQEFGSLQLLNGKGQPISFLFMSYDF